MAALPWLIAGVAFLTAALAVAWGCDRAREADELWERLAELGPEELR